MGREGRVLFDLGNLMCMTLGVRRRQQKPLIAVERLEHEVLIVYGSDVGLRSGGVIEDAIAESLEIADEFFRFSKSIGRTKRLRGCGFAPPGGYGAQDQFVLALRLRFFRQLGGGGECGDPREDSVLGERDVFGALRDGPGARLGFEAPLLERDAGNRIEQNRAGAPQVFE